MVSLDGIGNGWLLSPSMRWLVLLNMSWFLQSKDELIFSAMVYHRHVNGTASQAVMGIGPLEPVSRLSSLGS